jgi:hypothetical protein
LFFENRAVYDNVEKYRGVGQTTDDRQYGAYALHARYLRLQKRSQNMFIRIAFRLQQWLHERASMLRNT